MQKLTTIALGAGLMCLAAVSPVLAQDARAGVGNAVTNHASGESTNLPGDSAQEATPEETDKLGQAYKDYTDKKYADATRELKDVIKDSPRVVQAHEMLASIYLSQNQVPQAIPELETVVRLHPKEVAEFQDNLGVAYLQTGDPVKAAAAFQAVAAKNPTNALYVSQYATALQHEGKNADAAAAFEKAAALDPKDSRAPLYAGLLYHESSNDAKAVPDLKSAIALGTTEKFSAYIALAEAASAAKDTPGAIQYYTQAGQAKPDDFSTQANIGILEQNAGHKPEAEAAYRKALTLKADSPKSMANIQSNLATLLISEDKLDEAATTLTQAGQTDPSNPSIPAHLGVIYERQGKKDLALAAYNKALALSPDNSLAKNGVSRLSGK